MHHGAGSKLLVFSGASRVQADETYPTRGRFAIDCQRLNSAQTVTCVIVSHGPRQNKRIRSSTIYLPFSPISHDRSKALLSATRQILVFLISGVGLGRYVKLSSISHDRSNSSFPVIRLEKIVLSCDNKSGLR